MRSRFSCIEQFDRLARQLGEGLADSCGATPGLASTTREHGRDVGGRRIEIDQVDIRRRRLVTATRGQHGPRESAAQVACVEQFAVADAAVELGEPAAEPLREVVFGVDALPVRVLTEVWGVGERAAVGEVDGEGAGVEPPAVARILRHPLAGWSCERC